MIKMRWSIVPVTLAVLFAWPAAAVEQAGVTAAVRGQVDLVPIVDKAKHRAKSGEDVFLGDEISSLDESGMQLMLLDETVFTIGPNTDLTIDDFVYDPATGVGQVTASLAKGVLRFVTGKVAQGEPEDMVVNLPVGTIGIRGTIGAALYDGVNPALVVLLGPGPRNNADARQGRLAVSAAGKTVNLTRTGWGTSIEPGGQPTDAFQFSPDQIASIVNQLTPQPTTPEPADESEGGRATEAGGQSTAEGRLTSVSAQMVGRFSDDLGDPVDPSNLAGGVGSNITTFAQLPSSGSGIYSQSGVPLSDGGTYDISLGVNFANRTIGGSLLEIFNSTTLNSGGSPINTTLGSNLFPITSFDDALGAAAGIPSFEFFDVDSTCDFTVSVLLSNGGTTAEHSLEIFNRPTSLTATGSGTASLQPDGGS